MNTIRIIYFRELENNLFGLKFFDEDPRSGIEKNSVQDGKKSDLG
jgi:hypothetical protein